MPRRRETTPIPGHELLVQVTDDDSRTLVFPDSSVAYHSASGAAAETQHVYLDNAGVTKRLRGGGPTTVLEIGLGTGLAMLMTVDQAIAHGTPLRYWSLERDLLGREVLSMLHLGRHLQMPSLVDAYLDFRDSLGSVVPPGRYCWQPTDSQQVILLCGDAIDTMSEGHFDDDRANAIYFDPFAPSVNPELWEPGFLRQMHAVLDPNGCLVTYCVSRQVRESFAAAGFRVRRVRGPAGGKREVMIATPSDSEQPASSN